MISSSPAVSLSPARPAIAGANGSILDPGRLVVGGSPYLGERGDITGLYNGVLINRAVSAPSTYELNPYVDADFGD